MNKFENITKPLMWSTTLLLAAIVAGCGGSGDGVPGTGPGAVPGSGSGPGPVGSTCSGASCVNLGTAANYVILDEAAVSFTPTATGTTTPTITGNIGLSPAAASFLTGFAAGSPPVDATGCFSTSTHVTGKLYAADYNTGGCTTPTLLTTAVSDKNAAYSAAAGKAAVIGCFSSLSGGNTIGAMGGLTIPPGVYNCPNYSIATGTNVTLSGAGVYVFQTAGTLSQAAATSVLMANNALPQNVFWQVAGSVSILSTAHMEGVILSAKDIALGTSASVKGRLYGGVGAGTQVAMDSNTVTQP
jgi:hypothetical protein